ncbi:hypothetical protein FHT26_005455 [Rhizobacter sp. SG703]|nr:hypothetical protein [Rhizobacter sp. SG703]
MTALGDDLEMYFSGASDEEGFVYRCEPVLLVEAL